NHIDSDGGNAVVRQRGSYREGPSLLAVSKAVAEDGHWPAVARARSRGNKQVEEHLFRSLRRNALAGRHLGDKDVGVLPVLPRKLAESQRGDGAGKHLQSGQVAVQAGWNQRADREGLDVPGQSGDGVDRENRSFAVAAELEIDHGRSRGLDLLAQAA